MHMNTFFLSVACLFAFLIKFIRWAEVLMMSANLPKWFLMVVTFFDFLANSSPTPKSLSYSLWFSSRALWFSFLWWGLDLAWYNFYVGCEVGIELLPPPSANSLVPTSFFDKISLWVALVSLLKNFRIIYVWFISGSSVWFSWSIFAYSLTSAGLIWWVWLYIKF